MSTLRSSLKYSLIFLMLSFLLACNPAEKQWEKTKNTNTIEQYELFLKSFPDSEYSIEAKNAKDSLIEVKFWNNIIKKNTVDGYLQYITEYPEGEFINEANKTKNKLEQEELWQKVLSNKNILDYISFLKKYPNSTFLKALEITSDTIPIPFGIDVSTNYHFSYSNSSKQNFIKSNMFIPGGTKIKTKYGMGTIGATGMRGSKEFEQYSIEKIAGEFIEFSPFVAVFINSSQVLLSGKDVVKFKRLPANKAKISEGNLYLIQL